MRFLTIAASLLAISLFAAEQAEPPGLCTVLDDMARWNGALIQIRGKMTAYGFPAIQSTCKAQISVAGNIFPSVIVLSDPQDRRRAIHKVGFRRNETSWNSLIELWTLASSTHEEIEVTVEGVFETRIPITTLVSTTNVLMGFGIGGESPAQILVKDVRDFRILK